MGNLKQENQMAKKGAKAGKRAGAGSRAKPVSASAKASLRFPVGRVASMMRRCRWAPRMSGDAPVMMAGILEDLCDALIDRTWAMMGEKKTKNGEMTAKTIAPKHIARAIRR